MSEAFDPYRKWLGIPPNEQPPNHYRLLGIALFEDDPDVITHAADRQMAHLRTFQSGKYRDQSQQLLNELATARICLLSIEKKSAYDAGLKQSLAPPVSAAVSPPAGPPPPRPVERAGPPVSTPPLPQPVPLGKPVAVGAPVANAAPVVRTSSRPRATSYARGRKKSSPLPLVVGGLAVGAIGVAVLVFVLLGDTPGPVTNTTRPAFPAPSAAPPPSSTRPPATPVDRAESTTDPTPSATERPAPAEPAPPLESVAPVGNSPPSVADIESQAVETALVEARQKMNDRDVEAAQRLLSNLADEARKAGKQAEYEHLTVLHGYLQRFLNEGVRRGMRNKLEPGETFEFRGDTVELVSIDEDSGDVTYKFNGTEATHDLRSVPTKPAIVFAWKSFEREAVDPYAYVFTATFLRFDQKSSIPEQERIALAQSYWREAVEAGATDKYIAQELGLEANEADSKLPSAEDPLANTPAPVDPASAELPTNRSPVPINDNPGEATANAGLPLEKEIADARYQLARQIRDQLSRARSPAAKAEMVDLLRQQIDQAAEPARQYALWEKAIELTCEQGNAARLGELLSEWSEAQPIDYLAKLGEALPRCRPTSAEMAQNHLALAREGSSHARQAKRYELALKLSDAALKTAAALKETEAIQAIRSEIEAIKQQQAGAGAVDSAL